MSCWIFPTRCFSPTYIWEADRDGRYTFVQGREKILGTPDQSLIGQYRWAMLFDSAEDLPSHVRIARSLGAHQALERQTIEARHIDSIDLMAQHS